MDDGCHSWSKMYRYNFVFIKYTHDSLNQKTTNNLSKEMSTVTDILKLQLLGGLGSQTANNNGNPVQFMRKNGSYIVALFLITNNHAIASLLKKTFKYTKNWFTHLKNKVVVSFVMEPQKTNHVFKEILRIHATEFGSVQLQSSNDFYPNHPRMIRVPVKGTNKNVFMQLYFNEQKTDNNKSSTSTSTSMTTTIPDNVKTVPSSSYTYDKLKLDIYTYDMSMPELISWVKETYEKTEEQPYKSLTTNSPINMTNIKIIRITDMKMEKDTSTCKAERVSVRISKSLENIFLADDLKSRLDTQLERFYDPDWYTMRGIPRTLGILLHGVPGCGKTSLIKALCARTGRSAVVVDFKLIKKPSQLRHIFEGVYTDIAKNSYRFAPDQSIYIFEDFDCASDIIVDRDLKVREKNQEDEKLLQILGALNKKHRMVEDTDNEQDDDDESTLALVKGKMSIAKVFKELKNDEPSLTLDNILEVFDGVAEVDGRIIVMTTNCRERIDKALLRPGRIDLDLELKMPSATLVAEIFFYMYQEHPVDVLKEILKPYLNILPHHTVSTAKVMNSFMFIDPKQGLDELCKLNGTHGHVLPDTFLSDVSSRAFERVLALQGLLPGEINVLPLCRSVTGSNSSPSLFKHGFRSDGYTWVFRQGDFLQLEFTEPLEISRIFYRQNKVCSLDVVYSAVFENDTKDDFIILQHTIKGTNHYFDLQGQKIVKLKFSFYFVDECLGVRVLAKG